MDILRDTSGNLLKNLREESAVVMNNKIPVDAWNICAENLLQPVVEAAGEILLSAHAVPAAGQCICQALGKQSIRPLHWFATPDKSTLGLSTVIRTSLEVVSSVMLTPADQEASPGQDISEVESVSSPR